MDRRSFIKLTAITGTSAALASCGSPENTVIRFVPDDEMAPGLAEWKPSVCPLCNSGCGLNVRVMQADVETTRDGTRGVVQRAVAKKLEGLPTHPVNQGGLCARGQAAIQLTYHPDRLAQPLKRSGQRGEGKFEPMTWEAAVAELVGKLDALAAAGNQKGLTIIGDGRRSQRASLFDQFVAKFGGTLSVRHEVFGDAVLRRANGMSFGVEQLPTYDLKHTRSAINFGGDILGTWNSPVAHANAYGAMRRGRPGVRGAYFHVESRVTTSGAGADEWVGITPGTEGVLALAIAHVMLEEKLLPAVSGRATALIDGWASGLADYEPARAEKITGVGAARIAHIARQLAEQSPSVALVGGPALAYSNGLFTALAVNALNQLFGTVQKPGGIAFTPQGVTADSRPSRSTLAAFASAVAGGTQPAGVLLLDGGNPVFASSKAWRVREAIEKFPYIVSFGSFIDETSALADLILPDHSFLESWVDALPESGSLVPVVSVAGPVMKPLFDTRASEDVLLDVARTLAKPVDFPWRTFDEMLKATIDLHGEDAWSTAQSHGGWWPETSQGEAASGQPPTARGAASVTPPSPSAGDAGRFIDPVLAGDADVYPYQLLPYPSLQFLDGSLAHLPWLQELPDPITSAMWSSWVEINPTTAESLGVSLGDVVEVASSLGAVRAPVFVNPGLSPTVIAMPVGQGHTNYTRYASGRGQNPIEILAPATVAGTDAFAWAATRVKVTRVSDPDGSLILFSARGELRERPYEGVTR
ncbi:MAG: molybdopterin-dependent oxidoreductase [Acidobacteriaceae bacterium]|jgi:anaerobic selenocysteine-containing dehydrogenase|nr:molybdopterin-dependent oxidoreductase [Acidobacteriaceae bacterium]